MGRKRVFLPPSAIREKRTCSCPARGISPTSGLSTASDQIFFTPLASKAWICLSDEVGRSKLAVCKVLILSTNRG